MAALAIGLALLTTVANAAALVLQRRAARDTADALGVPTTTLGQVARHPAWRAGIAIFVVAVALQAGALTVGSITLVQPVVVMGLPSTLLLGWWVLGGALRRAEWTAVAILTVGLVVLLVSLRPEGGDALGAPATVWVTGTVVTLGVVLLLGAVAQSRGTAGRAALHGLAAGLGSGFVAVVVKAMSQALVSDGLVGIVTTWQSYLLLPAAPLAFLALQRALRAGRLVASQPGLVLGNPLLAGTWGVALLDERVRGGVAVLGGVAGAALLVTGVILLARSPLLAAQDAGPRTLAPVDG